MKFRLRCGVRLPLMAVVVAFLCCPLFAVGQVTPQITQPVDSATRKIISGTVHPLANAANDRGRTDASLPMNDVLLMLHPAAAQQTQLRKLMDDLHNPNSPTYHHWLTPAQYGAQFGAADQDVKTVSDWLSANGFKVEQVAAGKNWIRFSGSAQQVEQAFGTEIHTYVVNGATHYANSANLSIPQALTPVVSGVVATNNFLKPALHTGITQIARNQSGKLVRVSGNIAALPQSTSTTTAAPSPAFTGIGDEVVNSLSPGDYATIYNSAKLVASGNDGTGTSIAIVGRSDIAPSDIEAFRTIFQLPFNDPNIIYATTDPGDVAGDDVEADLDVEWSGAIAPRATINYVIGASTNATDGVDVSAAYIVDHVTAPIMSVSFGACEANLIPTETAFYASLWQQAAAEGITVLVAAGDSGSSDCVVPAANDTSLFGLGVSGLASTPDNIAVGGTEFNEASLSTYWNLNNNANESSALGYIPEAAWNESCNINVGANFINCYFTTAPENTFAGGGGASSCVFKTTDNNGNTVCTGYPKPAWQTGKAVPKDGVRDLPDVALAAAAEHDPFIICTEGSCQWAPQGNGPIEILNATTVGGTSAAAPSMAAIMALVEQKNGLYQGQANYVLYKLAAQPNASCDSSQRTSPGASTSCIFNDVTTGANSLTCVIGTPNCTGDPNAFFGVLSGYNTAPGYDLASGLGSINIANLVSAWGSVTTLPSATSLKLSSASFAHGTPVTVNVGVAPKSGAGTPTGEISLLTDKYGPAGAGTLTSGSYSASISSLPGGTYNLTAQYAGDATYGTSTSQPIPVTVTPEASTATVSTLAATDFRISKSIQILPAEGAQIGNSYWFQVQIAGASNSGLPTGTVTLTTGGKTLGIYPLDQNGMIYLQEGIGTSFDPPVGIYKFVASYSGDNSFKPTTTTFTFSITPQIVTTFLAVNNNQPAAGTAIIVTAQVDNDPAIPATGTVQFFREDTGALIGSPVKLDNTGMATLAFVPAVGAYSLDATYSGDKNYIPAKSDHEQGIIVLAPTGAATKTTLQGSLGQPAVGKATLYNVAVAASASSKFIPSGTVTFYSNIGQISNPATIVGGKASLPLGWTSAGPQQIYAIYSGDANFTASSSAINAINVAPGTPTVTLTTLAPYIQIGAQTSMSAIVTGLPQASSVAIPSGVVQFYDSLNGAAALPLGAPQLLSPGNGTGVEIATFAAILPAGANVLSAKYSGDSNWVAASAAAPANVVVATPDFTASATPNTLAVTAGQTGSITINTAQILGFASPVALSCAGTLPVGTSCSISAASVTAGGTATLSLSTTAPGVSNPATALSHGLWTLSGATSLAGLVMFCLPGRRRRINLIAALIVVAIVGGISGCGSGSAQPTTIALTSSNTKVASGASVKLEATVASGNSLKGTVTFYDGSTAIGAGVVPVNGVATISTTSLSVGTHPITAKFSGDSDNLASQSSDVLNQTVTGSFTLQVNATSGTLSHPLMIPATLN